MFFNYDSFELIAIAFIVTGILIQSLYISSATPNSESLVNTLPKLDSDLQLDKLPSHSYTDVAVQVSNINLAEAGMQTSNQYVNTGMQTSARMWLESIRNWITEILSNPQVSGQYVDVGIQTNTISTYQTVKNWFLEVCSIRSSELTDLGEKRVNKWMDKLDSIQSVDLHDSDFSLTTRSDISNSSLQELVAPNDSVSQISEVVSNSATDINSSIRVYDMNNPADVIDLMNDPTVVFNIDPAADGDALITFYTADSANEILRSTLEALLTSVN